MQRVDFAGKAALVTGGSRGLGLLIAEELARRGCRVAVCARDSTELAFAERRLARLTDRRAALECDLTDRVRAGRWPRRRPNGWGGPWTCW
ncbi:SDR family NAD(P)-dependent oxidoreductase [Kitasatospora fiedleri]|uniref:SDR family NAD(P)-dependent oxidoreductase n=1 Tax=Kitasatospora fiedleri TaxID=2991545 RepID=UPI00249A7A1F|nr:SDR family NAD(P)-dependent oxidoreductase [Kitasatospora fiedleri]